MRSNRGWEPLFSFPLQVAGPAHRVCGLYPITENAWARECGSVLSFSASLIFLLGQPSRVLLDVWGKEKSLGKCPETYRETVSGGNAVCLKCGSLEVPAHFSDSLRMGWTGRAKEQGSSSVAVTAGSVLPPVTECCGGGTHTAPAKWWSSQLILRLESGEGPDRAVPHTEGSTLGDRWTFCFVHANIWRQEEIF